MVSSRRVLIALGLAAVVATIGACTSTGQTLSPTGEPSIGAIPRVNSGNEILLPLDAYLMTAQQQKTIFTAVNIIGRDCMKRFGLFWPANAPGIDETARNLRRYAIIEPTQAKVTGYHLSWTATQPADQKARPADQKEPTMDAMNVWAGKGEQTFDGQPVPVGGCAGEAIRQLSQGAPKADPGIPEKLQLGTFKQAKADSRVVRAFAEWNKCMQTKGYNYPDPYAAAGDQRWHTAKASAAEIALATADVTCKSETNLPGVMLAVETAYQNLEATKHATELAAIKSYFQIQLANAGKVAR